MEPPLIGNLSEAVIHDFVGNAESETVEFARYPCHTQAVESCEQLVTQASSAVCGQTSKNWFIRSRIDQIVVV